MPSNLLQYPNTDSNSGYLRGCKTLGIEGLRAFRAAKLEFFVKYLTEPNDLVVDIFAGSNTTGQVAKSLGRRWLACDLSREYVAASVFRFLGDATDAEIKSAFDRIMAGHSIKLDAKQTALALEAVA